MSTTFFSRNAARLAAGITAAGIVVGLTATPAFAATTMPHLAALDQGSMQVIVNKHNQARDEVKVPRLSWDATLAADAQAYADKLAAQDNQSIPHDTAELSRLNENENLAWSFGTPPAQFAVDSWYGEKAKFDASATKTVFDPAWGHYSQMVWSTTTKIGCGLATNGAGHNFVSCRYSPPGNRTGQLPYPGAGGGSTPAPKPPPTSQPTPGPAPTPRPTPSPKPTAKVDPAQCAYNPGGRGGYGSYVDGLALDQRDWEQDLANAINAYRAQNKLPALRYSRTLARPAMWESLDSYNRGFSNSVDSRGMNIPTRVQYCSGYTGYIGEITYFSKNIAGAKWQRALDSWKANPGTNKWLLDRRSTVFAVGMAYGNNDTDRMPAYYTVDFGDH
jgi:uncharacterized protein YkwD